MQVNSSVWSDTLRRAFPVLLLQQEFPCCYEIVRLLGRFNLFINIFPMWPQRLKHRGKEVHSLIRLWKRESKWDLNEIMWWNYSQNYKQEANVRILTSHAHSQLPIQISDGKSTPVFSFPWGPFRNLNNIRDLLL